jgi:hypothetical protein
MTDVSGCVFVLGATVCAILGLMLGVRSIFVIRQSQGRLRGYGHAIVSIVLSCGMGLFLPVILLMGRGMTTVTYYGHSAQPEVTEPKGGVTASSDYVTLGAILPPADWFEDLGRTRRIPGAAAVGRQVKAADAAEVRRILQRAWYPESVDPHVVSMTVRMLREKGTRLPIVLWIAETDIDLNPEETSSTRRSSGEFVMRRERILMGVFCERAPEGEEIVQRLSDRFIQNLEAVRTKRLVH